MFATLAGIKYNTVSDSGFSPGDAPLGGVTINLYSDDGDGSFNPMVDTLVDQEVTAPGTGAYSFSGVNDGRYFINEVVPTGYVQSAGPPYYTVDVIGGAVYPASPLSIDQFSNPDPAASFFITALDPDPYFRQDSGLDIIGGQRDMRVDVLGTPNPISANGVVGMVSMNHGVLNLGTASSGVGSELTLQYDGVDVDSAALTNALGLSVDLTADGNQGIRLDFNFLQVGSGTTMPMSIDATSPGGSASFSTLLTQDPSGFSVFVPFASFSTVGAFTFTDVTSLEFAFNQTGVRDVDFEIDQIVGFQQKNTGFDFGNFPLPASLSGLKYVDSNKNASHDPGEPPVGGVIITLTGTDDLGNPVNLQTQTLADGTYKFCNLRPGTYTITETPPVNFIIGQPTIGSLGGMKESKLIISNIIVPAAANGVNYNFGEIGLKPPYVSKRSLLNPPQPVELMGLYTSAAKTPDQVLALGSDANDSHSSRVKVLDVATGNTIVEFSPYGGSFHGGVRVAVADLDGDTYAEIITAPGAGGSGLVKVFDLLGNELQDARIQAYSSSFKGGVFVAAADVNGDGRTDIITAPGSGMAANIRVFRNRIGLSSSNPDPFANQPLHSFLAFGKSFKGGATVAAGDLNGDGKAEIVVGNGPGMRPRVRLFDLVAHPTSSGSPKVLPFNDQLLPMKASDRGGVFVAVGDLHGDATPEIIVGNGANGRGCVELFDANGSQFNSFTAYGDSEGRNAPVHVAAKNVDADLVDEVITGQGGAGGSDLLRFRDSDASLVDEILQDENFGYGFFVA
ncbi:MAG: VCBS repeat-containing protein [Pirellulales bacterium]|nr:VCBS repeat-containing protein [Pirellulales bacterium]